MITDAIKILVREYNARGISSEDINRGSCHLFAAEICNRLKLNEAKQLFVEVGCKELAGHVWIALDGLHYDAECPKGRDDWRDLPCLIEYSEYVKEKTLTEWNP